MFAFQEWVGGGAGVERSHRPQAFGPLISNATVPSWMSPWFMFLQTLKSSMEATEIDGSTAMPLSCELAKALKLCYLQMQDNLALANTAWEPASVNKQEGSVITTPSSIVLK